MPYQHGVRTSEVATSLLPTTEVDSALPVIVGTAPVSMADATNVNKPVLCHSYDEFVQNFGYVPPALNSTSGLEEYAFTLCEAAYALFALFNVGPAVFVNVLDPTTHKKTATTVTITLDSKTGSAIVAEAGIIPSSVTITPSDAGAYTQGEDYEIAFDDDGNLIVTSLQDEGGDFKCTTGTSLTFAADVVDPTMVDEDDVIGGVDVGGKKSGLELVGEVYPRFGLVPGTILAPGFSSDPSVAAVMAAKCTGISGRFNAMCAVDVPADTVKTYSAVTSWKQTNNYTDARQIVCWPLLSLDGVKYHLSTQMAALMAQVDGENDGTPYVSPSNHNVQCTATVLADGSEVWLDLDEAAYLNGQGVVTAINQTSGWTAWGNRTGAYPGTTDVKDNFIPIRRMFNWIGNTLITTFWSRLDAPINRRLIDTIIDSANIWLNGLTARQYILSGSVAFLESENTTTDLMDGIITFHVYICPPSPARDIQFTMEYDVNGLTALFE